MREQFRAALFIALGGTEECADLIDITSGDELRRRWIEVIQWEINKIKSARRNQRERAPSPRRDPTSEPAHHRPPQKTSRPRGASTHPVGTAAGARANPGASQPTPPRGPGSFCDKSSVSSFSDESEDSDEEDLPEPTNDHSGNRSGEPEASEDKPLKHDPETVGQLRLIRQCRRPADIKERTATWVADQFAFGSPYILRMLQGDTPWPHWSRAQLFQACNRISSLFEQVELRERQARSLTKSLRKAMLASELKIKRDIRLFLHIARLGPSGGRSIGPW